MTRKSTHGAREWDEKSLLKRIFGAYRVCLFISFGYSKTPATLTGEGKEKKGRRKIIEKYWERKEFFPIDEISDELKLRLVSAVENGKGVFAPIKVVEDSNAQIESFSLRLTINRICFLVNEPPEPLSD
jgi:hypothetical protein